MAEQSAFLTAFDEMQKKKLEQQGFNAPAQMESVVDTVGQAPAVESPFSQAAAPSPMAAAVDPMAQPDVLAAAPAVQAPQGVLSPEERTRIEGRLAQTNADIIASGETVPSLGAEAPKEGFMSRLVGGLGEQFTQPAPYTPQGGGAEAETAFGATPTQPTLFREGLSALSELNETPLTRPDSFQVEMATPDSVANLSVNGTDTVTPEAITEAGQVSPDAAAPQTQLPSTIQNANGQNLAGFKPKYKGQSLSDYMAYRDNEGSATVQVQDPQGRFRRAAAPIEGESPAENLARTNDLLPEQAAFQQKSADRESRQAARPDFGEAQERAAGTVTDRERRAARGDGMSDADRRDIAKANARGASPSDIARGQKVADALGVDVKTGKPLASEGGPTFDQVMKMKDFDFKRDQEAYKREQDSMTAAGKASEAFDKDEALLRQVSGDAGRIGRLTNEAIGVTTETGTTGLAGSLLKHVPGTDAHKLDSILEVVSSKVALDRLMEVKKTGATLGQVSEKELAMLQNSYDTLKQGLKGERLRKALVNYATQLKAVEDRTAKAFIGKHGQEKFDQIMGGGGSSGGEPRYANDQNVGDSAESYYNPSK